MWTRKTSDPLGKLLFEKYGMHMLSRPRENVSVFQVFAVKGGETALSGSMDSFLRSTLEKPEVAEGEAVLDIDTTTSDAISGEVGVNFLQGFLGLLGASVVKSMSVAMEKSQTQALRFRFGKCTRDYVKDGFELEWKLSEHPFDKDNSAMKDDFRYYVATGVHFCKQLTFEALNKSMGKIDLSAEISALGGGKVGLAASSERQVTATSKKTLAYGVELNEIVYDQKRKRLRLQESKDYVHTKAAAPAGLPKAVIVGPDDVMMLRIAD